MEINAREIGQRIRALRMERGLTQQELADLIGISQNSISKIEPGLRVPSIDTFLVLAELFDVSIDYIVRG